MANQSRLEMIQGVINRLAGNSSAYKGWMVTITAALLGVAINNHKPVLAWLGVYVVCILAILDAYYLALERSYRDLYKTAAKDQLKADDWTENNWSLAATRPGLAGVLTAVLSPSVWPFYLSAVGAAIIVAVSS
jgi:hypothetical protein